MRLPLVCPPEQREPQSSWIARLAWENRCAPTALLHHCIDRELEAGEALLGLRHDGVLKLSHATTIAPEIIDGLATRRLFESAGDEIDPSAGRQLWATQIAHAHVDISSRRCCPQCLLERRGAMDNRWLHRMSYCCKRHGRVLIHLAELRQHLGVSLGRRRVGPLGAPRSSPAYGSRWPQLCASIDFDELDERATTTLEDILNGRSTTREHEPINAHQTTRYLWTTTLMLGRFMFADDLPLDAARRAAMTSLTGGPGGRGVGASIVRKHPDRLAALVPSAWLLALGPAGPRRDRLLKRVVERLRDNDPQEATTRYTYYSRLPPWLRTELEQGLAESSRHRFTMVLRGAGQSSTRVSAKQVPQMLWPALFDDRFADLLPGLSLQAGRVFCSISLLRLDHCESLKEAALALGQRGQPAMNVSNLLHRLLPWEQKLEFAHALRKLADDLEGELITDYSALRTRFEHQAHVDPILASRLADALARDTEITSTDRKLLLAPIGRATLSAWIWEHAVQSRFDRSAAHLAGLSIRKARPIYERLLEPNRASLLDRLEVILDTPLHEPALPLRRGPIYTSALGARTSARSTCAKLGS